MKIFAVLGLSLVLCPAVVAQGQVLFDPCTIPAQTCPEGKSILSCVAPVSPTSWLGLTRNNLGDFIIVNNQGTAVSAGPLLHTSTAPVVDKTTWSAILAGDPGPGSVVWAGVTTAFSVEAAFSTSGMTDPNKDYSVAVLMNHGGQPLVEIGMRDGYFYYKRARHWGHWIQPAVPSSFYRVKLWDPNPGQYVSDWHHLFITLRKDGQLQIDDFQYGPSPGFERKWSAFVVEGGNVSWVSGGSFNSVASTLMPAMGYFSAGTAMSFFAAYENPLSDDQKLRLMATSGQYSNTQLTQGMKPDNTGCYQRLKSSADRNFVDPLVNAHKTPAGLAMGSALPWNVKYCAPVNGSCPKPSDWVNLLRLTGSGGYFAVSYLPSAPATIPCPDSAPDVYPAGGKICGIARSPELNWTGSYCERGNTCNALDAGAGLALWWDYTSQTGVTKPFRGSFACTNAFFSDVPNVTLSTTNLVGCTALGVAHPPSGPTGFGFAQSSNGAPAPVPESGLLASPVATDLYKLYWLGAGSHSTSGPVPSNANHFYAPVAAIGDVPAAYKACANSICALNNPGGMFTGNPPKRWIMAIWDAGLFTYGTLKAFRQTHDVGCTVENFPGIDDEAATCYEAVQ